ncbi:fibronectin type III domain-containing protein [Pontibacter sp. G13]|uniref:fibronectin type III domain-containing protein n=1 Tax=Pontibacter sp. G13 TaxID=3074898 RepID=UPI00288BB8B1|nr:fibronectin type III domain-containing protein [Pontibacter sp. G13]WNJ16910.1 fibronectin type III domain-containing protein [Pontibacter sp. G13]
MLQSSAKVRGVALLLLLALMGNCHAQSPARSHVAIDTRAGHPLTPGASGYNVRIADKVWSYTHPDFLQAVDTLRPGWLRYFSGTMGDAFSAATGMYDYDYLKQMSKQGQYLRGHAFTQMKGPHRVYDLYQVLGRVRGKLVVTINGFTETPDIAGELARFCRNHHIEVEGWQFCNEPYFYVPHRERYWWNDGYDYARKMKPYADSIRSVIPDAKLALNYTWDGIWGFGKEIYRYQQDHGRYWDVFSKHSYAPHIGNPETWETAFPRGNTKLLQVTAPAAMQQIEDYTWKGAPLLITEFGVWNRALSGLYGSIYLVEYTLRQLAHPNAWLVGSHEISSNARPAQPRTEELMEAFRADRPLDTDTLLTGVKLSPNGLGNRLLNAMLAETDYTWAAQIDHPAMVPGMKGDTVEGMYARAFRGTAGKDYLAITNRSASAQTLSISIDGQELAGDIWATQIADEDPLNRNPQAVDMRFGDGEVLVPGHCIMILSWASGRAIQPLATRIFRAQILDAQSVALEWWESEVGSGYLVRYGEHPNDLRHEVRISDLRQHAAVLEGLKAGATYTFQVTVLGDQLHSQPSRPLSLKLAVPEVPSIFKTARRDRTATIWWRSVPDATGYRVYLQHPTTGDIQQYDAQATFGYRIEDLEFDVPYAIWVTAYNGVGESVASEKVRIVTKEHLPIPPRNISAVETEEGFVQLRWVNQDSIHSDVKFRLLRGTVLHEFEMLAEDIQTDHFLDKTVNPDLQPYFYTVMAYNEAGETNFHPNIATVIPQDEGLKLAVKSIQATETGYSVVVEFDNIRMDGDVDYGIALSDISYLTVEETLISGQGLPHGSKSGTFRVEIPQSQLRSGHQYAIKGYIQTNGKYLYSSAPHRQIQAE